jgi:hypothetical protein
MAKIQCIICGKDFNVRGARKVTAKFCSLKCRSEWRSRYWTGPDHPQYQPGPRVRSCRYCGKDFEQRETEAISVFRLRKFCSMECTRFGQRRLTGESHPLFKPDGRRKVRAGKHGSWARAVISRDRATCRRCGARNVELHAHHILPYETHPDQRWNLENGLTLCYRCHWIEHSASNANGVNSGNIPPANAEDNPEPSFGRKPVEGVTTRGRAYRRWNGFCETCDAPISKRWSDAKGKSALFCSRTCASKWRVKNGLTTFGRPRR